LGQAGEFQEFPDHLALELEDDQKQVSDQVGPDLNGHDILGGVVKDLDLQVLLDLLVIEFDQPGVEVEFGYLQGRHVRAVGQKDIFLAGVWIPLVDDAQEFRVTELPLRELKRIIWSARAGRAAARLWITS
jgi:hypothetical protein